jgi:prephenate dehydrogenase
MAIERIAIIGTGLIGASIGLALKASAPQITVVGWDKDPRELEAALEIGALDEALTEYDSTGPNAANVFVLATPVLPIMHWMRTLASNLTDAHLVTDVGSTKREIAELATEIFNTTVDGKRTARFLPGHPMAGKESGGAKLAAANLFRGATWLFTPIEENETPIETEWRNLVASFGAQLRNLDPAQHDEVCGWVSHLPQYLSTALAALLQDTFSSDPDGMAAVQAIGGRALRETTRLGASPYSMWRDVAFTNTENVAKTLLALEQRLQYLRENLRTPALREEFTTANRFRSKRAD